MKREVFFSNVFCDVVSKADAGNTLDLIHSVFSAVRKCGQSDNLHHVYNMTVAEFTDYLCDVLVSSEKC